MCLAVPAALGVQPGRPDASPHARPRCAAASPQRRACGRAAAGGQPSSFSWQCGLRASRLEASTFAVNGALAAAGRRRLWTHALELLRAARGKAVEADVVSYSSIVSTSSKAQAWELSSLLFRECRARHVEPNSIAYGAAVSTCERGGDWEAAAGLVREMVSRSLQTNAIILNAAVSALEKNERWELALRGLCGMEDADAITYYMVASACSKGLQWAKALKLLARMHERRLQPRAMMYSAVIVACEKCHRWGLALEVWRQMQQRCEEPPNTITYNIVLSLLEKAQLWESAVGLVQTMSAAGMEADVITCGTTVSACEKCSQWAGAFSFFRRMQRQEVPPSAVACNAAISACEKGGQLARARALLANLVEARLEAQAISFNAIISACGRDLHWELALGTFKELLQRGLQLTVVSFGAATSACEKGSQWEQGVGFLGLLQRQLLEPSTTFCNAALSSCEKGGQWASALGLLSRMWEACVEEGPDGISFNVAACACVRGGDWTRALEAMRAARIAGHPPDGVAGCAAMSAMGNAGQWQRALPLLADGPGPDQSSLLSVSYSTAMLACASAHEWQQALGLLDMMQAATAQPNSVTYGLLLMECEQQRLVSQEAALLQGLEELGQGRELWDEHLPAAASAAAASRLLAAGRPDEAARLLEAAASRGRWNGAAERLWGSFEGCRPPPVRSMPLAPPAPGARARGPYAKELSLLLHVFQVAQPGDATSACLAMERFAEEVLSPGGEWLKVAGGDKASLLVAAARGAPAKGGRLLEIGAYCGYSAAQLAIALPGVAVCTLEVDPVHVVISRNILAFAGLAGTVDVLTGHTKDLLKRLASVDDGNGRLAFSAVFMDHRGSRFSEDLAFLERSSLLAPGAVAVADNVLKPGAPAFLRRVAGSGYRAQVVSVGEFAMPAEDWMSVSVPRGGAAREELSRADEDADREVERLDREADRMRERALLEPGRGVQFSEWAAFARKMRQGLALAGISATASLPTHPGRHAA